MTKRHIFLLIATFVFLGVALGFDYYNRFENLMERRATQLEGYVSHELSTARGWWETNQAQTIAHVQSSKTNKPNPLVSESLAAIAANRFTMMYFVKDSVVWWSNNHVLPLEETTDSLSTIQKSKVFELPQGGYFAQVDAVQGGKLAILVPLQYHFGHQNNSFLGRFSSNRPLDPGIQMLETVTDYPVRLTGSSPDFWLQSTEHSGAFSHIHWLQLGLYVVFLFFFFTLTNLFSIFLAQKYENGMVGALFLIFIIVLSVYLKGALGINERFADLNLFQTKFPDNKFGSSLGDWLIHIFVMLWMMIFFHREFQIDPVSPDMPTKAKIRMAVLYNLAMIASVLISVFFFRVLVFFSGLEFDFDNLLNMNYFGLAGLFGVILLLSAMFLFNHRMVVAIFKLEMEVLHRVISLVVASALIYIGIVALGFDLSIEPLYIISFCLIYSVAFDYFMDESDLDRFVWVAIWITMFSAAGSMLLYKYGHDRDENQRLQLATKLAEDVDSLALKKLVLYQADLKKDSLFHQSFKPLFFPTNTDSLYNLMWRVGANHSYLFQYYDFYPFAFNKHNENFMDKAFTEFPGDSVVKLFNESTPMVGSPDIRCSPPKNGGRYYLMRIEKYRQDDPNHPAQFYALFFPRTKRQSPIYSDIFFRENYKGLENLNRYDYLIFEDGKVVKQVGKGLDIGNILSRMPKSGAYESIKVEDQNREEFLYTRPDGRISVVLSRQAGGFVKNAYLFSALFTLLSVFLLFLSILNSVFQILPEYYQFVLTAKGSLAKRIQYFTVALIFISLIIIGLLTYFNFKDSSFGNQRAILEQKSDALMTNTTLKLMKVNSQIDSQRIALPEIVRNLAADLQVDANLYDIHGNLVHSSRRDLNVAGLLQQKMGANAYNGLARESKTQFFEWERIGDFEFETRYEAVLLEGLRGESNTIGYLGMPYFMKEKSISPDVSDFFGKVLSVYVFLLLIAAFLTVVTARAITLPLQKIVENIKKLRLENKNEPLLVDAAGVVELTTLVEEYNRMVAQLEEAKPRIIKLEKEGAWKTMARQVAHEITNPLTSMQLSVQQLNRLIGAPNPNWEEIATYMTRVGKRMLEQVAILGKIARDFSDFAKMEDPKRDPIELNNIVEGVYEFYCNKEDVNYTLDMTDETFYVLGEATHLNRVFGNLILNAEQAIPKDAENKNVNLRLSRRGKMAVLEVQDNGTGISEENLHRMFEPYFTTKDDGNGIGLGLSKRIIEALDGTIYFETKENEGTTFFVELPILESQV